MDAVTDKLDIGLLVYQALPFLQETLRMLDEYYPARRLTLVNDCDPTTQPFCQEYIEAHPGTQYIVRETRGWFTRAANTALQAALARPDPPWFLLLNSDITIGPGGFEEVLDCWALAEQEAQRRVAMVGAEGPKLHCPRYVLRYEPEYVTGHALLFSKALMHEQGLRFPQADGEVQGFTANQLVHISSDRALSWHLNRKGFACAASNWANVGHHGGKSWGYRMDLIPPAGGLKD